MRTTVDLPDDLMKQVKIAAAQEGLKLRDYIRGAVESRLMVRETPRKPIQIVPLPPVAASPKLMTNDDLLFGNLDEAFK